MHKNEVTIIHIMRKEIKQTQSIYATVAINIVCEHCSKRLGSSIVRASYSAKELGLTKVKKKH